MNRLPYSLVLCAGSLKCFKCSKPLKLEETIKCKGECNNFYHISCAENIQCDSIDWKCPKCDSSIVVKEDKEKTIAVQVEEIKNKMNKMSKMYNHLEATMEAERNTLMDKIQDLEMQLWLFKTEFNETKQKLLEHNIEIYGLPISSLSVLQIIERTANALHIILDPRRIKNAYKIDRVESIKMSSVVIKFFFMQDKELWLRAAKMRDHIAVFEVFQMEELIGGHMGNGFVYINQHLTRHNKALWMATKEKVHQHQNAIARIVNGRIFIYKDSYRFHIRAREDLDMIGN